MYGTVVALLGNHACKKSKQVTSQEWDGWRAYECDPQTGGLKGQLEALRSSQMEEGRKATKNNFLSKIQQCSELPFLGSEVSISCHQSKRCWMIIIGLLVQNPEFLWDSFCHFSISFWTPTPTLQNLSRRGHPFYLVILPLLAHKHHSEGQQSHLNSRTTKLIFISLTFLCFPLTHFCCASGCCQAGIHRPFRIDGND